MKILALDFSSPQRSVAVTDGSEAVAELVDTGSQGMQAFGMIENALRQANLEREQILSAGIEEFLRPDGVAVIEWAERLENGTMNDGNIIKVNIEITGDTERRIVYEDSRA